MPRRRVVAKRQVLPDPKYASKVLAKFMNHVMVDGKKSVAEKIVYGALAVVQESAGGDPLETFEKAFCISLRTLGSVLPIALSSRIPFTKSLISRSELAWFLSLVNLK